MSLDGAYDDGNIFARIIRGEAPSVKVWEDEAVLVFMDVFPQAKGHTLVVHKASRARNLLEAEPATLAAVMAAAQKTARAIKAALKPDGIVVTQFNGAPAGQTVFHLHVHIIPRWEGLPLGRHAGDMADVEELKALAARIAGALE
ncbi:MAG: HIT family protein [Pseudomonadota bacterium]